MGHTGLRPAPSRGQAEDTVSGFRASDPRAIVTVTVDQAGQLSNLDIRPDAYEVYGPAELSTVITQTHEAAVARLREETVEQFFDLCGVTLPTAEVANGRTRLHDLAYKLASRKRL
ncbi:MAG TPA: hypothetical protein VE172_17645 [Stackebrandtia sp.]|jgi:DNA-binding protein YbaB|uniref:hypothetical protein n=1 Tax=Stackebrandtia sp. TaxID=2023065 RepID=UPI002D560AE6|nr:hypothetical protein [Stackebrandtia sp.]HZE40630.1 hypothetical protein [Stackebrandtia sp.]